MNDGVPAYFHPDREAADWTALVAAARAGAVGIVVINPASGVGSGTDPAYRRARAALADIPGLVVAGYVDTAYGARPAAEILAEACAYGERYGVRGVFADQVPSGREHLPAYAALAADLRAAGLGPLLLNPGVRPDEGYLGIADVVVTFEGSWDTYRAQRPVETGDHRARTWHLVHGTPTGMIEATRSWMLQAGADHAYVTDRRLPNPWAGLPHSSGSAVVA
ncbi:spherulation-specific family 4 protein [Pseudonocardia sp. RS11V-5]|uniref:spherulation-specific family 4 protein n=1 Tax=Pseudonocardia terrae TaxID=2905831 RepID=UPI001E2B1BD6|nr:spherulation-specific family 4 protein [Pseudonocardia terrae]MCE3556331.1 spherulation-specific family 4 protein [Pseudonocardia terrae]